MRFVKARFFVIALLSIPVVSREVRAEDQEWARLNAAGAQAYKEGKYQEAEKYFKTALAHAERSGMDGEPLAVSLNNLGALYNLGGRLTEAADCLKRSLAIREQQLGPMHPQVATALNNLADVYRMQLQYTLAEPLFRRALKI